MPLVLDSDYRDYYDDALADLNESTGTPDVEATPFVRRRDRQIARLAGLDLIRASYPNALTIGIVRADSLSPFYSASERVFCYPHRQHGNVGTTITSLGEALAQSPSTLVAVDNRSAGDCVLTTRHRDHASVVQHFITVGARSILVEQWSVNSKFSNEGRTYTRVTEAYGWQIAGLHLPVYVVTCIPRRSGEFLIISLDTAPMLSSLGIEEVISSRTAAALLRDWFAVDRSVTRSRASMTTTAEAIGDLPITSTQGAVAAGSGIPPAPRSYDEIEAEFRYWSSGPLLGRFTESSPAPVPPPVRPTNSDIYAAYVDQAQRSGGIRFRETFPMPPIGRSFRPTITPVSYGIEPTWTTGIQMTTSTGRGLWVRSDDQVTEASNSDAPDETPV